MMNVKKYRAASTREALEKIKHDLGENALVLETRQVRSRGFLGFGSEMQIEVSAAAPPAARPVRPAAAAAARILNLTDDAPAAPDAPRSKTDAAKNNLMAALSARAAQPAAERETPAPAAEPRAEPRAEFRPAPRIEAVEISPAAPKVVHPKKETVRAAAPVAAASAAPAHDSAAGTSRELELLRAELREIKFSVNSFAGRQNANVWQKDVNLDLFDEVFESPFYETFMELTETGVSAELARRIITDIIPHYREKNIAPAELAPAALFRTVSAELRFVPDALEAEFPTVLAVIGATGVGKTTTIAKLAARAALHQRRRVELVTLDTYRIAAVEQLKTYAEIIGAGCHVVRSVLELDALLRRLPLDALVLVDTTGKNPHDLADQYELSDYLKQRREIRKCLAVQTTTHPLDALAAVRKFEMYGADSLILTKFDETLRPGAVLEVVADSGLPLAYLCHGQRVPEDIQIATPETLTNRILGKN